MPVSDKEKQRPAISCADSETCRKMFPNADIKLRLRPRDVDDVCFGKGRKLGGVVVDLSWGPWKIKHDVFGQIKSSHKLFGPHPSLPPCLDPTKTHTNTEIDNSPTPLTGGHLLAAGHPLLHIAVEKFSSRNTDRLKLSITAPKIQALQLQIPREYPHKPVLHGSPL